MFSNDGFRATAKSELVFSEKKLLELQNVEMFNILPFFIRSWLKYTNPRRYPLP